MAGPPYMSICVVASHSSEALDACLATLAVQTGGPAFEVLVADNGAADVRAIARRHFPEAKVCATGGCLPGAARNHLIQQARGELLLFLDDDVTVPPALLAQLADVAARYPEVTVFGGPNETPPASSRFQVTQGAVLGSIMGAGPVCRRYGARHAGPADERWFTLCNLAVRREAMLPFATDLVCAEENAVLADLRDRGESMRYDPSLVAFHARRPNVGAFARQMFKYGRGRGSLIARSPRTARAAYLAPVVLLAYLLALPGLTLALGHGPLALLPVALYGTLTVANAIRIGWTLRRPAAVLPAAALTVLLHACYGSGLVRGLGAGRGSPANAEASFALASASNQSEPAQPPVTGQLVREPR
jgi:succinoglycan biosynthesis protein ExoA